MKYTIFAKFGIVVSIHYGDGEVFIPDFSGERVVVEEGFFASDTVFQNLTEIKAKFDYIKRWYKVENGQLVRRNTPFVQCVISLSTDAQDTVSPFDGIPDVPADGTSVATITVEIRNPETNQIDTTANDILYVSTDRGTLSAVNVQLVNGVGSFTIKSFETVVATIKVWHPQEKYKPAEIKIQFRPV